jgi:AcrR family transcriptional regulator
MSDVIPVKKPQQKRSEASLQRMLAAAEALLDEGTFEEATIQEIVRRSKTSVGAFYSRFADKAALLQVLEERFMEAVLERFETFFEQERMRNASLEAVVEAIIRELADLYRTRRGLVRALTVAARSGRARTVEIRSVEVNRSLYQWAVDLILRRREEIRHPDPEVAVPFGVAMIAATLREQILFGQIQLSPRTEEHHLIAEVTRALVAYLRAS